MLDRIILKLRQIFHYIFHFNIYHGTGIILRGVPKLLYGNRIHFGTDVRINENVFMHASNGIYIGNNVTISYGATLITESYDISSDENYLLRKHAGKSIEIGDNVWICANVTILPGVKIANGVIVAAGSVVSRNLTIQNGIYAGNPAVYKKGRL